MTNGSTGDDAERSDAHAGHLRVLCTTDLHAHILPYDYYADAPSAQGGLAALADLIELQRAGAPQSVLLDVGDLLEGSPLSDYVAQDDLLPGDVHPVIGALNTLGYDAATVGNHDFTYGLGFLLNAYGGAEFPVVLSNVDRVDRPPSGETGTRHGLFPPTAILERELRDPGGRPLPIRIGVIGFVPPQVMRWEAAELGGRAAAHDMVEAARHHVPQLRAAGADIVIALAHCGIGAAEPEPGAEHAALGIAAVSGVDVVLGGHAHGVFPQPRSREKPPCTDPQSGTLHGKPAIFAGFWGSHLGVLDLWLRRDSHGAWRVVDHRAAALAAPPATPETHTTAARARVAAAVAEAHAGTIEFMRRPVGRGAQPFHTHFAQAAPSAALQLVADAQRAALGSVLDEISADLPLLSASAPFKAGGHYGAEYFSHVPAGPVALRDLADLYPYHNMLCAVEVTGAMLREWLERAVSVFNTLSPGSDGAPLLAEGYPAYSFDVIDGLSYRIDLSQPAAFDPKGHPLAPGRRIVELRHARGDVGPGDRFLVATNSHRLAATGLFQGFAGFGRAERTTMPVRRALERYFRAQSSVAVHRLADWGFAPMPAPTRARFLSGPKSAEFIDEVAPLGILPQGRADGGYLSYSISL